MGKRWFLVSVMLLASLLVVGCGVPEEEHEAVVAERDAAQAQVSELASSLEEAEAELGATHAELGATQAELEAAQAKVSELGSSLGKSQNELVAIKAENQDLEQANAELKRLTFYDTALCSKKPKGHLDFTPKTDNTFTGNEIVYVFCDVFGFKWIMTDHQVYCNVTFFVKVVDTEGNIVYTTSGGYSEGGEEPWAGCWYWWALPELEAGEYSVEVPVIDNHSGETITWKEEFQVVSS